MDTTLRAKNARAALTARFGPQVWAPSPDNTTAAGKAWWALREIEEYGEALPVWNPMTHLEALVAEATKEEPREPALLTREQANRVLTGEELDWLDAQALEHGLSWDAGVPVSLFLEYPKDGVVVALTVALVVAPHRVREWAAELAAHHLESGLAWAAGFTERPGLQYGLSEQRELRDRVAEFAHGGSDEYGWAPRTPNAFSLHVMIRSDADVGDLEQDAVLLSEAIAHVAEMCGAVEYRRVQLISRNAVAAKSAAAEYRRAAREWALGRLKAILG